MPRRLLALWIAALLIGGLTAAVAQEPEPAAIPVATSAGDLPIRRATTTTTSVAPSTTAVAAPPSTTGPTTSSVPRSPRTTAPAAGALVGSPAYVDQPGAYVVRRDGTGLRRLFDCQAPLWRDWLGPDQLAVRQDGNDQPTSRLWLDGRTAPFPQPVVATPGATGTLHGVGSVAPGGGRTAVSFAQAPGHGVAVLDLATGTNRVIFSGDNPTPAWSPNGDIVLVGPSGTAVIDEAGTVLRAWAPSALSWMTMGRLTFSSDGRYLAGGDVSNINRWVVLEPRSNTATSVPQVGQGQNQLAWAGTKLVIRDAGIDHEVLPSLHVWDPATGSLRRLVDAAAFPTAAVDGQVVAYEDATDHSRIGLVSIDGSRRSPLVQVADGLWTYPDSWSPDGTYLLFDVCPRTRGSGGLPTT